ncbi:hypothetical protein [Mycobacterium syngnathidarum]|uniref:hypothetical protein n=1 Tax=Mycobacterium syngnathidarum TaxID=1908205 RepID=UPI00096095C0|nr:hypothetical protein [Mycobacterium syngnathidarum]OLT87756.1 hypothetical protein BKG60_25525 [Mycobacterium syngnathidarum]
MELVLIILLLVITVQSLAKFTAWLVVPYERRIAKVAAHYSAGPRRLAVADRVLLIAVLILVALQFAADMHYLSFITGLTVGMTLIQLFFHRFNRRLSDNRSPKQPASPIQIISYAIQDRPMLAWREIALITVLSVWAVYMLIGRGLLG